MPLEDARLSEPSDTLEYRPVWARDAARKASGRGGPSFKGLILNLISVAVIVAVVAFFAAPAVAFFGIRAAAQAGDVAGLAKLIDYDAVRASLRPQLSGRVEPLTPPPSFLQDPVGAVRRQFDQAVTPRAPDAPEPDAYLSPLGLYSLTTGHSPGDLVDHYQFWPRPIYWGVNRARLAMRVADRPEPLIFTFERRGPYEWRLVHIGLPGGKPLNRTLAAPVAQ
ncbi:hypothetical protein BH10PSE1_BH10PSE1_00330 [soil metagenome]